MCGHAQVLTQDNTVIPPSCWNAATNDSLSWASQPISNDTNLVRPPRFWHLLHAELLDNHPPQACHMLAPAARQNDHHLPAASPLHVVHVDRDWAERASCWVCPQVPVLNNAQMQPCADGAAGSMQLWTRNYVLSGGTASISSKSQVPAQFRRQTHLPLRVSPPNMSSGFIYGTPAAQHSSSYSMTVSCKPNDDERCCRSHAGGCAADAAAAGFGAADLWVTGCELCAGGAGTAGAGPGPAEAAGAADCALRLPGPPQRRHRLPPGAAGAHPGCALRSEPCSLRPLRAMLCWMGNAGQCTTAVVEYPCS